MFENGKERISMRELIKIIGDREEK